ncbi:MAG: efflux RND transporter periplasmic adaptor subunit, partial [Propionibacteriaceae bacterium]|nr:efflux RND transporter periplasmic adaptor subunit [Propionibacteriaceae bacterium]
MKRSTLIAGGVALALVIAAGGGYAYSLANNRTSVGIAQAAIEELSVTVSASGTVDAAKQRGVHPAAAGTLATVAVKDGETVTKGATLATLDDRPLKLAVTQAEASLTAAKATLTAAQAQQKLVEDRYSIRLEKQAAAEAITSAKQAVTVAQEVVAQAKRDLKAATLTAPIDGVVTVPDSTEPGAGVSPATAVLTVVDTTTLEFVAAVDESDIAAVATDQEATIVLDSAPDTPFTGTVTSVRTTPVTTPTGGIAFPVRIAFDAGDARVFLGTSGSADLTVKSIPDALTVPIESV